jgi:hypothetical protein
MERATHQADGHAQTHAAAHPAAHLTPIGRDPDLPEVSDATLKLFAAAALIATVAAVLCLVD